MAKTSRNFRLDDKAYAAAQKRAELEHDTVTAVVEAFLRVYGGEAQTVSEIAAQQYEIHRRRSQPSRTMGYSKEQQARGKRP